MNEAYISDVEFVKIKTEGDNKYICKVTAICDKTMSYDELNVFNNNFEKLHCYITDGEEYIKQIEEYQKAVDETMSEKMDLEHNWNELKSWLEENLNELKQNDIYDRTSYEMGQIIATECFIAKIEELEEGGNNE